MRRDWIITTDDGEFELGLERDGHTWLITTADGTQTRADAEEISDNTWSLVYRNRSYVVDLDRRKDRLVVFVNGVEVPLAVDDKRRKQLAATARRDDDAGTGETIKAPIAGKVVDIGVAVGDTVAPGSRVIVLEAMKMENEIMAERGGTVTDIAVSVGDSVETNAKLIALE